MYFINNHISHTKTAAKHTRYKTFIRKWKLFMIENTHLGTKSKIWNLGKCFPKHLACVQNK